MRGLLRLVNARSKDLGCEGVPEIELVEDTEVGVGTGLQSPTNSVKLATCDGLGQPRPALQSDWTLETQLRYHEGSTQHNAAQPLTLRRLISNVCPPDATKLNIYDPINIKTELVLKLHVRFINCNLLSSTRSRRSESARRSDTRRHPDSSIWLRSQAIWQLDIS